MSICLFFIAHRKLKKKTALVRKMSACFQSCKRTQRFVKVQMRCFSFLQRYWWRLNYFVMWRRIYWWILTDVSEELAACVFVIKEDGTASSSDTSITLIIDTASCPTRFVYKLWTKYTRLIVPCVVLTRDDSGLTGQLIMPLIIRSDKSDR